MSAVVLGRGVRRSRRLPRALAAVPLETFLAGPGDPERVLVLGATADVAAVAQAVPGIPIAFSGAPELTRLFALDDSVAAALTRLERGTAYPVDLGVIEIGATAHPFLGTIAAGAGSSGGLGFPWAGATGALAIAGDRRTVTASGRAVVVCNAQHWGRWTLAPRAAMNDSRLEVQVFAGPILTLWGVRRALSLGLHGGHPGVSRLVVTAADMEIPASWTVRCDGMRVGRGGFRVRVQPGAATLLI